MKSFILVVDSDLDDTGIIEQIKKSFIEGKAEITRFISIQERNDKQEREK